MRRVWHWQESPEQREYAVGVCAGSVEMDSGTLNFGGGAGAVVGAGGGGLDGAGGRRLCTEHIRATAGAGPPPTAALAAGRSLGDAMGCCRGGWPICVECLGTVVDSTSHWRADVWHQGKDGNVWTVLVVVVDDEDKAVGVVVLLCARYPFVRKMLTKLALSESS